MKAEEVVEVARRFLQANEAAVTAGGRPTDADVAYAAGVPMFDAVEALRTALVARDARHAFHDALAAYDQDTAER